SQRRVPRRVQEPGAERARPSHRELGGHRGRQQPVDLGQGADGQPVTHGTGGWSPTLRFPLIRFRERLHVSFQEKDMKHRLTSRANLTLAGAVIATLCIAAVMPANAQQMGRDGWSFGGRNKSMAAQFEFTQRMQQSGASDGIAAFQQFVTTYNSSSN